MKLKKLIHNIDNIEVKGSKDVEVKGLCQDSKLVKPGDLFIARKGKVFDGTHFIPEAIATGAQCVLSDIYNPFYSKTTQIITKDIKKTSVQIADRFYQSPHKNLFMVGVTGTNGKTTTSYLIKHILDSVDKHAGVIGTNGYLLKDSFLQAQRTTPDTISCLKLLKEMQNKSLSSCVMEVSSHALDQSRVDCIDFDVAVFTNLTHEHLDYHGTMENYLVSKQKLFSLLEKSEKENKCAIVNLDDPYGNQISENYTGGTLTYAIANQADVRAENIELSAEKTSFDLHYQDTVQKMSIPLVGRFNVYNVLAAISFALHIQIPLEKISEILSQFSLVNGRMERVNEYKECAVFIDYAHTPDALENILLSLKELKTGKIFTVFGCGGARDKEKRPKMAKISESLSDFTFVTSDNPRSEDPNKIIEEIVLGFSKKDFLIESDRKLAIEKALEMATSNDIVVIAGKGHEKTQVYSHKTIPFDDREVVLSLKEGVNS